MPQDTQAIFLFGDIIRPDVDVFFTRMITLLTERGKPLELGVSEVEKGTLKVCEYPGIIEVNVSE